MDDFREEGSQIRAFIARTMPIPACADIAGEEFWEARSLIEQLAIAHDNDDAQSSQQWDLKQCAAVVKFVHSVVPVKGRCFCGDTGRLDRDDPVSSVCGFHIVLEHMEQQLRRHAGPIKKRNQGRVYGQERGKEVSHG